MANFEDMPELAVKTVVCLTPGCENEKIPITLPCGDMVICGACSADITPEEAS